MYFFLLLFLYNNIMRTTEESKLKKKFNTRQLTPLLSLCAGLIVVSALEAVILSNPEAYQFWLSLYPQGNAAEYSALILARFLIDIIVPLSLALYSFFLLDKFGTPPLYRLIWGAIVFLAAVNKFLLLQSGSILWYLALLLWLMLFLTVINIHRLKEQSQTAKKA